MTKMYQINAMFARENKLPVFFVANQLVETGRATYLYGHGTLESTKTNQCCVCGRTLTHPVSVVLGIGPECGGHNWDWDAIGGYNESVVEALKIRIKESKVDQWFPKSVIKDIFDCEEVINTPNDHPMLKPIEPPKKTATMVTFQQSQLPGIKITFPFNRDDLDKVKSLTDRRFHNEHEKYWTCPLNFKSVQMLQDWGFTLCSKLQEYLELSKPVSIQHIAELNVPGLQGTLFPFQRKGVAFLEAKRGRALIADEMGLGKTIQAIAWMQLHRNKIPAIIVVPSSLKLNWLREIENWMRPVPKVQVLSGTKPSRIIGDIVIINYDILPAWVDELKKINPQILITDECHYFKNNNAKRTKAVKLLAKGIPHVIALSGTPIVNRPVEIYNAVTVIDPGLMPNRWKFLHRYCGARNNGFGWDFSGATNTFELNEILSESIMIRRKKADVLTDLPDKVRSFQPMEMSREGQNEYRQAEFNFIEFVRRNKGAAAAERASNAQALAEIEGLKQLAVKGKLPQAIEWIRNFLEVDGKLVVFAVHKFVIDELMKEFGSVAVKIDGSVANADRQKAVDAFQNNDNIRLFVGNIKAAGVGLTLTAASNVVVLELPCTPGDLEQAIDRCHRIGQKDTVNAWFLLALGTIEEKIANMLDSKRKTLDAVLDGVDTDPESLLSELLNEYSS